MISAQAEARRLIPVPDDPMGNSDDATKVNKKRKKNNNKVK